MLFNSVEFIIFFPVVALLYFVIPKRIRWIWLLVASYYFYMSWNAKYAFLIGVSTVVTWGSGLFIRFYTGKAEKKKGGLKKLCLAGCVVFNLGILFFFKYYNFAVTNMEKISGELGGRFHPLM